MFTPADRVLERGWPGRVDDDRVTQLAAQTLQSYFTAGGRAREHAVYPLAHVRLRAPVLVPPSLRLFEEDGRFAFGNPASIVGPDAEFALPEGARELFYEHRVAAVVGAGGGIGGFTQLVLWLAPDLTPANDRDFATALGPLVVTPDEYVPPGRWSMLIDRAGRNTGLHPGEVIADAPLSRGGPVAPGRAVAVELDGLGVLRTTPAQPPAAS